MRQWSSCILSKFYIKPQLRLERELTRCSCILSKFYIKPQRCVFADRRARVVSYRNSTSNHNSGSSVSLLVVLYLIEILHQTTTQVMVIPLLLCCILSKFYIKPQLRQDRCKRSKVVSYRNSTSNHNRVRFCFSEGIVVSYRNSTSNHNYGFNSNSSDAVVSYRNSTSNHN